MSNNIASNSLWLNLIAIADSADQECISIEQLVYSLVGIEEGYSGIFDPAVKYEEYVAVKLCGSIRAVVEASSKRLMP